MANPLEVGARVKVYGFGLVDESEKIMGLFSGERGQIEKIEDLYLADVRMEDGELARVHLIQCMPIENLT